MGNKEKQGPNLCFPPIFTPTDYQAVTKWEGNKEKILKSPRRKELTQRDEKSSKCVTFQTYIAHYENATHLRHLFTVVRHFHSEHSCS